jgi:hypothetical protein
MVASTSGCPHVVQQHFTRLSKAPPVCRRQCDSLTSFSATVLGYTCGSQSLRRLNVCCVAIQEDVETRQSYEPLRPLNSRNKLRS